MIIFFSWNKYFVNCSRKTRLHVTLPLWRIWSAYQVQDRDRVQSQVTVTKSASSKPKTPKTVILRNSIVKDIYGNTNTKSVKYFSGAKIADMNHYKNPTREKSPSETIIHGGTNDLSSTKYYANNTM